MKEELKLIRGSGNVYRDFNRADADIRQAKALLAAEILRILEGDARSQTVIAKQFGIDVSELEELCAPNLEAFSIERLIELLNLFSNTVEVRVTFTTNQSDFAPASI